MHLTLRNLKFTVSGRDSHTNQWDYTKHIRQVMLNAPTYQQFREIIDSKWVIFKNDSFSQIPLAASALFEIGSCCQTQTITG